MKRSFLNGLLRATVGHGIEIDFLTIDDLLLRRILAALYRWAELSWSKVHHWDPSLISSCNTLQRHMAILVDCFFLDFIYIGWLGLQ